MAEALIRDHTQYNCSVCLDLLNDPVTIPCGHSYCMNCIKGYWNMADQRGRYSCPQCRETFRSKPSLKRSTVLAEIMEKLRNIAPQETESVQPTESVKCLAGPEDIPCDVCTVRKLKAVKSCLECQTSYCETHIHPHYNAPALKRHKLVSPAIIPTCSKHDKLLEAYCRTDHICVCMHCLMDDHKGHDTVSPTIERKEKQIKLTSNQTKVRQAIQAKKNELERVKMNIDSCARSAQMAVEDSEKAFTELIHLIERRRNEVVEKIKAQVKADVDQAAKLQEKLEEEITELKRREGVLQTLLQTDDSIHFLQNYESVSSSECDDFPSLSFKSCSSFEDISKLVCELKEKLETIFNQEISETFKKVSDLTPKNAPVSIKVGDRVRVKPSIHTPKYNWGRNVTHKSVGVVKAIRSEVLYVDFPEQMAWRGIISEMELVFSLDSGS